MMHYIGLTYETIKMFRAIYIQWWHQHMHTCTLKFIYINS